jgi:hypothetical protein
VTEALGPVDVFWYWPYDQGGCGCPDCADESHEWAATFLRIGPQVTAAVRESSPNARVLLSTWLMSDRERALVYEACERGEDWFDGLLMETGRAGEPSVDARYTLSVFPEISMFDTYFTSYGCNGANPAPRRFVAEARRIAARGYGATLYSEGAYEDINKVVWLSTLWDPSRSAEDIAAEYAGYHLGDANRAAATDLVLGLEQTWGAAKLRTISTDETGRLLVLAESLDAALPDDAGARMRWRLLLHRARLDHLMARIGPDEELQQLVHRTVQDAAYGGDDEAQRETVRQLADRLAARVRGVNALFAAYEEYLTEYHLGRSTVLHFRPNDVIGGRDYAGLFAACEEALTAGDAADLHARLLSGYRRWLWQGGIDIDTFFL